MSEEIVGEVGSSSYSGSQIVEAQWASRERRLERFVTEQPPYSILVRSIEGDVLPTTQRYGMGTLTYSPLAGGWLSGRWRKDAAGTPTSSARPSARFDMSCPANQRKLDIVEELARLAEQTDITLIEMAIAFVINHPGVTSAIVGPRTMEQLESYQPRRSRCRPRCSTASTSATYHGVGTSLPAAHCRRASVVHRSGPRRRRAAQP